MEALEKAQQLANLIVEKQKADVVSRIRRLPVRSNWASIIAHPCLRYKVYYRLNWNEITLPSPELQVVFDEGNEKEKQVIRKLMDLGFDVIQQQSSGDKDELFDEKLNIGLRVDGRIRHEDSKPVIEVKTMNQYDYESIENYEDMKQHKKWRIRSYCVQGQLCLLKTNSEYGIYLLATYRRPIKPIPFVLDMPFCETILKDVEKINNHVNLNTYPEPDESLADETHDECPFKHICPISRTIGTEIQVIEDEQIIEMLNKRASLQTDAKDFEELDTYLKSYFKNKPNSVAGPWYIQNIVRKTTKYDIPREVKEQYKREDQYMIIKISEYRRDNV